MIMPWLATQEESGCGTRPRPLHSAEVEEPGCPFWQSRVLDTADSLVKFGAGVFGAQRRASSGGCRGDTGCEERRSVQLPLELES